MKSRRAPLATINITPLVDVLLILVATLLLLAPQLVKRLPADLPQLSMQGTPRQQSSLLVVIDPQGRMLIEDELMTLKDVQARITEHVTSVEIAASGKVTYDTIVAAVADLRAANPREIQLIVR